MGDSKYIFIILITVIALLLAISCKSAPVAPLVERSVETAIPAETAPRITAAPEVILAEEPKPVIENVFDPANISQEHYIATRDEVQLFIENLNEIIRRGDFNAWEASLSTDYVEAVTSPVNLKWISDSAVMRRSNIVVKDLNDYFIYVVQPARANTRIHSEIVDIKFVSENRVTAFTTRASNSGEGISEILYDLEKIDNSWKIVY